MAVSARKRLTNRLFCNTAVSPLGAGTSAQAIEVQNLYLLTVDRSNRARTPYKDCGNPNLDEVRVAERPQPRPLAPNMSPAALIDAESHVIRKLNRAAVDYLEFGTSSSGRACHRGISGLNLNQARQYPGQPCWPLS